MNSILGIFPGAHRSGSVTGGTAMEFGRSLLPSVLVGWLLLVPVGAFAYTGPGAGSLLLQAMIGGVVAAPYTQKLYWRKVKGLLSHRADSETADPADDKAP